MSFTIGSLFDGSGGFPLAAFMCGGVPVWASEIEPYPIAVTKTRFPYMKHLGSVTEVKGNEVEPVDVISFGSPCQDLSVAGLRKGLKHEDNGDDETTRSGLFMDAVRIIKEMREATNGKYPRFAVWENVHGAFSSNKGEDFRVVLEELIKIVEPSAAMPTVPKFGWPYADNYVGDGWSIAYRVFDAQYWGVPQRRRRIYLVLDLRGERAREVLFEREGLQGYFETGRTPWQGTPADVERGVGATDSSRSVIAIDQQGGKGGANYAVDVMPTLCSDSHGTPHAVAFSFDSLSSNSMKSSNPLSGCRPVEIAKTIDTTDPNPSKNQGGIAIVQAVGYDGYNADVTGDKAATLGVNCGMSTGRNGVITLDPSVVCCIDGDKIGKAERAGGSGLGIRTGDTMYTLTAKDVHCVCVYKADSGSTGNVTPAIVGDHNNRVTDYTALVVETPIALDRAFYNQGQNALYDPQYYDDGSVPTLVAKGPGAVAYGFDQGATRDVGVLFEEEVSKTLANGSCPGHHNGVVIRQEENTIQYIVRRLTPTECSRLQGFVDGWAIPDHKDEFTDEEYEFWLKVRNDHAEINNKVTKPYTKTQMLTWYNKLHTDSSEYKLWGNGIALPCALYVMQGISSVFK